MVSLAECRYTTKCIYHVTNCVKIILHIEIHFALCGAQTYLYLAVSFEFPDLPVCVCLFVCLADLSYRFPFLSVCFPSGIRPFKVRLLYGAKMTEKKCQLVHNRTYSTFANVIHKFAEFYRKFRCWLLISYIVHQHTA